MATTALSQSLFMNQRFTLFHLQHGKRMQRTKNIRGCAFAFFALTVRTSLSRFRQVTPIVSNRPVGSTPPHVSRSSRDQLPFEALLPGVVSAMPPLDLEAHLTVVYNALTEVSASVRQRGQTLLYLQSLAQVPRAANLIINSTFLVLLLRWDM